MGSQNKAWIYIDFKENLWYYEPYRRFAPAKTDIRWKATSGR